MIRGNNEQGGVMGERAVDVRERFPIGATVWITVPFSRLTKAEGVVVGYGPRQCVKVKRPNVKSPTNYGDRFLTLVDPHAAQRSASARFLGRLGGLKGGKARAANLSPERMSEIGRKGAIARWGKSSAGGPSDAG